MKKRVGRVKRPSFRPQVQALEDRLLPSGYTITDLGTLRGGSDSVAYAISGGKIVGLADTGSSNAIAFLYQQGKMHDLGTLGGPASGAQAIAGKFIAGFADVDSAGDYHAFLYHNGSMTDLGTLPGGSQSVANGVNSAGTVVGDSNGNDAFTPDAFVETLGGTMTDLGNSDGPSSAAAINKSGTIVGESTDFNGYEVATVWQSGGMTNLGDQYFSGEASYASAINNAGTIVGNFGPQGVNSGPFGSFVLQRGSLTTFSSGVGIQAFAINNAGVVVGTVYTSAGTEYAFEWTRTGGLMDINTLLPAGSGWQLEFARGISRSGGIVGWGINPSGQDDAYLLKPVTPSDVLGGGADARQATAVFAGDDREAFSLVVALPSSDHQLSAAPRSIEPGVMIGRAVEFDGM